MDFLFVLIAVAANIALVMRACAWMLRRKRRLPTRDLVISPLSGLAMGALFLGFQAILNPDTQYVIAEQLKEHADEDESGAEPPGGRLFHEQLRQICAGADVDVLTVRILGEPRLNP